jgi:hypothetical protein
MGMFGEKEVNKNEFEISYEYGRCRGKTYYMIAKP